MLSKLMEDLAAEDRHALRVRLPEVLVQEALALGEWGIEAYARTSGCSRAEAHRRMVASRQIGRRPSRVMTEE